MPIDPVLASVLSGQSAPSPQQPAPVATPAQAPPEDPDAGLPAAAMGAEDPDAGLPSAAATVPADAQASASLPPPDADLQATVRPDGTLDQAAMDRWLSKPVDTSQFRLTDGGAAKLAATAGAIGAGAVEGAFNTYDFFAGTPTEDQKSTFRKTVESDAATYSAEAGNVGPLARGLGQFLPGLLATEGSAAALGAAPYIGQGARFVGSKIGSSVSSMLKNAAAGGLSLDPHGANFINLVEDHAPFLSNPVFDALAAHPDDTAAEGRLKNVLMSLGMDVALQGSVMGATKLMRLRAADVAPELRAPVVEELHGHHAELLKAYDIPNPRGLNDNAPSGLGIAANDDQTLALKPLSEGGQGFTGPSAISSRTEEAMRGQAENPQAPRPNPLSGTAEIGGPDVAPSQAPGPSANLDAFNRDHGIPVIGTPDQVPSVVSGRTERAMADAQAPNAGDAIREQAASVDQAAQVQRDAMGNRVAAAMQDAQQAGLAQQQGVSLVESARSYLDGALARRTTTMINDGTTIDFGEGIPRSSPDLLEQGPRLPTKPRQEAPQIPADMPRTASEPARDGGYTPPTVMTPQETEALVGAMNRDRAAIIAANGDWNAATQAAQGGLNQVNIPWQKLTTPEDVNTLMNQVLDHNEAQLSGAKGGEVISDAQHAAMTAQHLRLVDEDPTQFLGLLQTAGKQSVRLRAMMDAGLTVASRMWSDATALAARIEMGDLVAYGGNREAATVDLSRRLAVAQDVMANTLSIRSNAARAMRGGRADFAIQPEAWQGLKGIDPSMLPELIMKQQGNLAKLNKLTQPGVMAKLVDRIGYLIVNNLLWRPTTHMVNFAGNALMAYARPAERFIGGMIQSAIGNSGGAGIRQEALRQFGYLSGVMQDGLQAAKEAFLTNDSRINPHVAELRQLQARNAVPVQVPFTGGEGVTGAVRDGLRASMASLWTVEGLPTRALGAADEMWQTITYRSYVASKEAVQAAQDAIDGGLKGDEVAAYVDARVQQKLANSFDSNGMATDADGKAEAQRATFSQPLRPGSIDYSIQAFVNRHPMMRAIMPFTKGPANVLRYGMNFTPLLNVASSEYRAAWRGAAGPEAQATAYGQMALGSLILGAAATLAAQGRLTGAAPADPVQAAQVKGVGWQPYSIVVGSGEDTKFISYGRFDPIAMPVSIAADLVQTFHQQSAVQGIEHAVAAATIAVARAVNSKAYLTSLTNFLDSIASPSTTEQKAGRFLGNLAGNLVPGSAGLRGMTNTFTDGYLHDARGIADQLMAGLPGFSASVPRAYNTLGEPMLAPALIYNATKQDVVDRELERMTLELGGDDGTATAAFAKMTPGLAGHADARTIKMRDGANAYERMQQLSAQPTPESPTLRDQMRRVIETPAYATAPDGYASTLGTKQWMLAKPIAVYREAAKRIVMADPNVAAAAHKAQVDAMAAAATKRSDPAGASGQAKVLQNLGKGFGVDLGLSGMAAGR